MLTGCASSMGRAPYKQLLTHGFVVDQNGRKMSKSIGNVVAPQEVYNEFGADILRLWAASTDYSGELAISKEILKRVTESYRRIRNTLSFLFANLSDFNPIEDAVQQADMVEIDRYALVLARRLQERLAGGYYPRYAFHFAVKDIVSFCSEDLGAFYLDILKDRLYTTKADSRARRSAQTALYHITRSLVLLIAPILCSPAKKRGTSSAAAKKTASSSILGTSSRYQRKSRSRTGEKMDGNPRSARSSNRRHRAFARRQNRRFVLAGGSRNHRAGRNYLLSECFGRRIALCPAGV